MSHSNHDPARRRAAHLRRTQRIVAPLRPSAWICGSILLCAAAFAAQTRTWTESDYADFEKGNLKGLSLRSDGVLTLAPRFQELYDSSSAYLWALARDSKGNLYTGGGPGAKLYRIGPKGDKKTLAELDGLEIHTIAVDSKDRVYAATSPDGKVYRLSSSGKPEVFYDPKQKYIWAMAFDSHGSLLVATGDQGEVHKVAPDGKGGVFFRTDQIHARSLAIDAHDNLIVGTDPGGLVIRVSPTGDGFVLYQLSKKEVTAVAVARDGAVYATAVGNKTPGASFPASTPATPPVPTDTSAMRGSGTTVTVRAAAAPATIGAASVNINGGSELYRIDSSGNPLKLWSNAQDIAYTIAFDAEGHPLVGTGNKGSIYRIDSSSLHTALLNAPPTQITALVNGPQGALYAVTGNVGKIYQIGPGLEEHGSIESDVFDAGIHSLWGRLEFHGKLNGGSIAIATRTGNLDQPQKNWSTWSDPITDPKGARVSSPAARFAQWKAVLLAGSSGSPELEAVDFAYQPRNVAPRVEQVEITPANYRFPAAQPVASSAQTITLPAIGKRRAASGESSLESSSVSMQYAKGFLGARWAASDDNGDSLIYKVEIKGRKEKQWKLLRDKVKEKHLSFDSTAFPDGEYLLRVTASDSPGNPPDQALTCQMVGDPFLIDNTPPVISALRAARNGAGLEVHWKAADALHNVKKAEYSIDGADWTVVEPTNKLSDSPELDYSLAIKDVAAGEHTIAVRVEDEYANQSAAKTVVE